jgi:hypothetical protein
MVDALLDQYDIYYINPSGAKMGFMLAKDTNEVKAWGRTDARALPDSYAPGDIGYANLSPDQQKVLAQRYFHGGFGAIDFETEEDTDFTKTRCWKSENIDCRCKGKVYPGPKVVSLPMPTLPSDIVNPGFESGSGGQPTDWTYAQSGDGVGDWYSGEHHSGAYSVRLVLGAGVGWVKYTQNFTNPTGWRRLLMTVKVWGKGQSSAQRLATLKIFVDGIEAVSYSFADCADWTQQTVAWIIWSGATSITVELKYTYAGASGTFYFDDVSVELQYSNVSQVIPFGGKNYFAAGTLLGRVNDAGTALQGVCNFLYPITHLATFGDYLYIALSASYAYWYMSSGEGFTEGSLANGEADRFCAVGSTFKQLKLPNKIRSATDPTNTGAWGSEILVGSSLYPVNDMVSYLGLLYCMKTDGPWYIDASGTPQQPFPELVSIANTNAGKNSDICRNKIYFRMGLVSEWELDVNSIMEVTPSDIAPGVVDYIYPCLARAHDDSWLYSLMKRANNNIALLAGRWETIGGADRWIWHDIRKLTGITEPSCAIVTSVEGRPYLYIGSTVVSEGMLKVYLSTTNDATADSGYRFAVSEMWPTTPAGRLWSSCFATLLTVANKRWQELYLRTQNCNASNYFNVFYSTDGGSTFYYLGIANVSPEKTLAFPASIDSSMMNLFFSFVTDSETVPPILITFNLKCLTVMPSVSTFQHIIKCDSKLLTKKVRISELQQGTIIDFIDTLRDQICTLGDRWGNEHKVRVTIVEEREVFDEDSLKPSMQYRFEAMKVG